MKHIQNFNQFLNESSDEIKKRDRETLKNYRLKYAKSGKYMIIENHEDLSHDVKNWLDSKGKDGYRNAWVIDCVLDFLPAATDNFNKLFDEKLDSKEALSIIEGVNNGMITVFIKYDDCKETAKSSIEEHSPLTINGSDVTVKMLDEIKNKLKSTQNGWKDELNATMTLRGYTKKIQNN